MTGLKISDCFREREWDRERESEIAKIQTVMNKNRSEGEKDRKTETPYESHSKSQNLDLISTFLSSVLAILLHGQWSLRSSIPLYFHFWNYSIIVAKHPLSLHPHASLQTPNEANLSHLFLNSLVQSKKMNDNNITDRTHVSKALSFSHHL